MLGSRRGSEDEGFIVKIFDDDGQGHAAAKVKLWSRWGVGGASSTERK